MKKFKVLIEGFVLDGDIKAVGDIIEMNEEAAKEGVADGAIEEVVEDENA